jgi:hypothetical protein
MTSHIPLEKNTQPSKVDPATVRPSNELARSIAEEFADLAHLPTYQLLCHNYPEELIRKAHKHTLAVPSDKLKRSRLALFIYLVKKYARDSE